MLDHIYYEQDNNFSIWQVEVIRSEAIHGKPALAGAEPGKCISVLVSKHLEKLHPLSKEITISCEIERVSLKLWRIRQLISA